jgi:succinoglycan biosynthesis protein ExoA
VIPPTATIIVPCYNEQATIRLLLEAIYVQTYPRQEIEVLISDGQSSDGTRQVIQAYQDEYPDLSIRVLDNPQQSIPSALNIAIHAARGEYIIRMDAHSKPYPDYVERCIRALESGKGDNVGGVWEIQPGGTGWLAGSIAVAAAHPLGVGDAHYRVGGEAKVVDTVPFGSYRRSYAMQIGMYDESLLTNEDYEFNTRIRSAGGTVWFDPSIRSIYYSRGNILALANQYFRYGYWKGRMLRRYPATLRWRQLLPPLFTASLFVFCIFALFIPVFRWILLFEVGIYLLVLMAVGLSLALKKADLSLIIGFPLAVATMHVSWGCALLWSITHR